jgi:uncharacterized protein YneF (UPF0154 family)
MDVYIIIGSALFLLLVAGFTLIGLFICDKYICKRKPNGKPLTRDNLKIHTNEESNEDSQLTITDEYTRQLDDVDNATSNYVYQVDKLKDINDALDTVEEESPNV